MAQNIPSFLPVLHPAHAPTCLCTVTPWAQPTLKHPVRERAIVTLPACSTLQQHTGGTSVCIEEHCLLAGAERRREDLSWIQLQTESRCWACLMQRSSTTEMGSRKGAYPAVRWAGRSAIGHIKWVPTPRFFALQLERCSVRIET